jgi:hypothetical protein
LKVTVENWTLVQEKLRQLGIKSSEYDSERAVRIITANNGEQFEFFRDTLEEFKKAGLAKLGVRIERKKE